MERRGGWALALIGLVGCGGGPEPAPNPAETPVASPAPSSVPTPPAAAAGEALRSSLALVLDRGDRRVTDPAAWRPLLAHTASPVRRAAARAVGQVRDAALSALLLERLQAESDEDVRDELVFALGQLGDESAREALTTVLGGESPGLAARSAQALGKLPLSASTVLALTRCAIPSEEVALPRAALLALVRLRGRRARPESALDPDAEAVLEETLRRLATGADADLRWRAVYALSEIELPNRREALTSALSAPDPVSRLFAARGLTRAGAIEGGALHSYGEIETVSERLAAEDDPHAAAALCALLGAREQPVALAALEQAASRSSAPSDHHVRHAALQAMKQVLSANEDRVAEEDVEHGQRAFREALRDPSPRVRAAALNGLTRLRALDAPGRASAFARHDDPQDRMAAAGCAPELPDEAAQPLLARLIRDPEPGVICAALGALGERAQRAGAGQEARVLEATGAAKQALKTSDVAVRAISLALLADIGDGDDVMAMSWAYQRSGEAADVEVRQEALRAAARLALRLRDGAANQFSAAFRAQVHAGMLLRGALEDPAPAVQEVAADQLEALFGTRPTVPPPVAGTSSVRIAPGEDLALEAPNPRVLLRTSRGEVELELLREEAPRHVASFLRQAKAGTYDGLLFHRVVSGFVVQGLDPRGDGWGSGDVVLHDEINPVTFEAGVVGMPNSGPDTGGCQVFITHVPTPHLDGGYTVFGRVLTGMDVIHALDVGDRCLGVELR